MPSTEHQLNTDGSQQRERDERWQAFVKKSLPLTILDVFPPNALLNLLRGFFLQIRRGVSLLYANRVEEDGWSFEKAGRIDPFNIQQGINSEFLNPICFALRGFPEIQERCVKCDRDHAEHYSSAPGLNPDTYPCWLGLNDLLCPVKLGDDTVAFIFAGQIPPDDPLRLAEVRDKLTSVGGDRRDELISLLDQQVEQRSRAGITPELEIQQTQEQLRSFVAALESIMQTLHDTGKRNSEEELLSYWQTNLPVVDHTEEAEWWRRVAGLARDFLFQIGMGKVMLFVRSGKYFEQRWPSVEGDQRQKPLRLSSRDVLRLLKPELLIQANSGDLKELAVKVSPDYHEVCFYRTRAASADAQPGLLFVVEGRPAKPFTGLAEQFLGRISSRTEYAALSFQLKRTHDQYRAAVCDAAHDFRHPLQLLEFEIADLIALPAIKQDQMRIDQLEKLKLRLRQAQEQTLSLQKPETDTREVLNLLELLDEVIEFITPKAVAHPCPITRRGNWFDTVPIKANRGQLFRVFLNLIDNAIKYSFMGNQYDVRIHVFPIDWSGDKGNVKVQIRNFGVGIPPDRLQMIRERGGRAKVHDDRLQREGTGIGLSIVAKFLKEHEGTLEIESCPEPEDDDRPMERRRTGATTQGLRFATTITVRLKLARNS